ncbi:NAD(P)-binding domain-containing protein [bacterium SCSIO 12643]|nr:NAD(P)-binding domain-containing protein [bacterium SCSIO 12643]
MLNSQSNIGIIGAGAMGSGIAQVAATAGHEVCLFDLNEKSLQDSKSKLAKIMARLVEKGRVTVEESEAIQGRVKYVDGLSHFECCDLVIEAVVEKLQVKQELFSHLENVMKEDAVLATNTSSLSIASIGGKLKNPERLLGIHFFNPAPLMPLVEIVPSLVTESAIVDNVKDLIDSWKKVTVIAKDTPGFIVNRVARPFYSEAIKMLEEGFADEATIDWAMKELGGFRMGPFELMDLIGHDVNYVVTETVWTEMYFDPRYKPALTQKRLVEANRLGRKSGQGFYNYKDASGNAEPNKDEKLGKAILSRILNMLVNEAIDALFLQIASKEDIDTAMTKGVNYPKGLITWGAEIGFDAVLDGLNESFERYGDDRYRPSVLLKDLVSKRATI